MKFNSKLISRLRQTAEPYLKKYKELQLGVRAESLAFHTILAVIPVLGFAVWLLNRAGVTRSWAEEIKAYVWQRLSIVDNAQFDRAIDAVVVSLRDESIGVYGTIFLVYTSWNLITKFGNTQDNILKTKLPDSSAISLSFLILTLRRAFVMLALPLVLGMTMFVATWIREESWLHELFAFEHVGPLFALPLAWSAGIAAFAVLYFFVPRRPVLWSSAFKAAAVVVPCLELTRWGLGILNSYSVTTHKVYGAFAVIPFTFFWIQLAWMIILMGGLFLKVKPKRAARG
ncbi:MAG: YihY/virulence factor BrkB family protein [Bdellovibrionales bacterium]|nr:YihY/virulence factor BrkB family protein [Bdellovibrionales bacterium]